MTQRKIFAGTTPPPGYETAKAYFSRLGICLEAENNTEFLKVMAHLFTENEIAAMSIAVDIYRTTRKLNGLQDELNAILSDTGKD